MYISGVLSLIANFLALEFVFSPNLMLPAVAPYVNGESEDATSGSSAEASESQDAKTKEYGKKTVINNTAFYVRPDSVITSNLSQRGEGGGKSKRSKDQSRSQPYGTQQNRAAEQRGQQSNTTPPRSPQDNPSSSPSGNMNVHSNDGFIGGQGATMTFNGPMNFGGGGGKSKRSKGDMNVHSNDGFIGGQGATMTFNGPITLGGGQAMRTPPQQNRGGNIVVHSNSGFIGGQDVTFNGPLTFGGDGQSGTVHQASTPTQQNLRGNTGREHNPYDKEIHTDNMDVWNNSGYVANFGENMTFDAESLRGLPFMG